MRVVYKRVVVLFLGVLTGCTATQRYYSKESLNHLEIGRSKADLLAAFPGERGEGGAPGMRITEARKSANGRLREVGQVLLSDGVSRPVTYKLTFEDGVLVEWVGR